MACIGVTLPPKPTGKRLKRLKKEMGSGVHSLSKSSVATVSLIFILRVIIEDVHENPIRSSQNPSRGCLGGGGARTPHWSSNLQSRGLAPLTPTGGLGCSVWAGFPYRLHKDRLGLSGPNSGPADLPEAHQLKAEVRMRLEACPDAPVRLTSARGPCISLSPCVLRQCHRHPF